MIPITNDPFAIRRHKPTGMGRRDLGFLLPILIPVIDASRIRVSPGFALILGGVRYRCARLQQSTRFATVIAANASGTSVYRWHCGAFLFLLRWAALLICCCVCHALRNAALSGSFPALLWAKTMRMLTAAFPP